MKTAVTLAHLGLDESGSLSDNTALFTLAGVLTDHPNHLQRLIRRAALRSGKRLKRSRLVSSELKWNNASRRLREDVLNRLAQEEVKLFTLTVQKAGRRIEDTPEHYAILVCELLEACWAVCPNIALSIDRRFTSPTHVAVFNTFVYRHWPAPGILSVSHVDSQRHPLVQLADFVAGSVYAFHKEGDRTLKIIEGKVEATCVGNWLEIKQRWIARGK